MSPLDGHRAERERDGTVNMRHTLQACLTGWNDAEPIRPGRWRRRGSRVAVDRRPGRR